MKCFTFWEHIKTISILVIENYVFILNTCYDTAKRAATRVGFPVIFSRLRWPIEPKCSQVCYFIYKLWYTKCGPWTNTVYRKCPMALRSSVYLIFVCFYQYLEQVLLHNDRFTRQSFSELPVRKTFASRWLLRQVLWAIKVNEKRMLITAVIKLVYNWPFS